MVLLMAMAFSWSEREAADIKAYQEKCLVCLQLTKGVRTDSLPLGPCSPKNSLADFI